jgi:hypothetical protein
MAWSGSTVRLPVHERCPTWSSRGPLFLWMCIPAGSCVGGITTDFSIDSFVHWSMCAQLDFVRVTNSLMIGGLLRDGGLGGVRGCRRTHGAAQIVATASHLALGLWRTRALCQRALR